MNFIHLIDLFLYQAFKICFEFIIKKRETLTENPLIPIYTNKIKARELLYPEKMKLLENTKKDVDHDKDGEDVPNLECIII